MAKKKINVNELSGTYINSHNISFSINFMNTKAVVKLYQSHQPNNPFAAYTFGLDVQ